MWLVQFSVHVNKHAMLRTKEGHGWMDEWVVHWNGVVIAQRSLWGGDMPVPTQTASLLSSITNWHYSQPVQSLCSGIGAVQPQPKKASLAFHGNYSFDEQVSSKNVFSRKCSVLHSITLVTKISTEHVANLYLKYHDAFYVSLSNGILIDQRYYLHVLALIN